MILRFHRSFVTPVEQRSNPESDYRQDTQHNAEFTCRHSKVRSDNTMLDAFNIGTVQTDELDYKCSEK
jgi:hypothetical protein